MQVTQKVTTITVNTTLKLKSAIGIFSLAEDIKINCLLKKLRWKFANKKKPKRRNLSLKMCVIKDFIKVYLISLLIVNPEAAIIQNPKLSSMQDGFLELKPNGSLILSSPLINNSSVWQDAVIFKTILNAIRLMNFQSKNTLNDINQKIYGDGVEHKFPPFMERVIQRIQTYFSVYKYTDTSEPVREVYKPIIPTTSSTTTSLSSSATSTTNAILNETLTLGPNIIAINLTTASTPPLNYKKNKTSSANKRKRPTNVTKITTTRAPPTTTEVYDEDEENEFIEITKNNKLLSGSKKT